MLSDALMKKGVKQISVADYPTWQVLSDALMKKGVKPIQPAENSPILCSAMP